LKGELEGRRPLGRPTHRWENDIKVGVKETGWEVMDCIHLAQDRDQWLVMNKVMNLRVQ
jgi:hypothetical protein